MWFSQNPTEGTDILLRLSILVFLQFLFIETGFLVPGNSKYPHGDGTSIAAIPSPLETEVFLHDLFASCLSSISLNVIRTLFLYTFKSFELII